jgi:diguanylate cyclase (GGDEF)-like protein
MRLRFWIGLGAVLAVAVGSVVGAIVVHSNESSSFESTQSSEANRAAHQAESVAALSVGQLSSAVAFYQAEKSFTEHEFDVVAGSLLQPGALTATAFIQRVPHAERARFEREHGFEIVEPSPGGPYPQRAKERPVYYVLLYSKTENQVSPPPGYDIGSDPTRSSYLRRARDSGRAAATPVMPLLIGGIGLNVYRPVYRDGAPTATVAERRAALTGFAAGAFRIDDLVAAANSAVPSAVDVQVRVAGRTVAGPAGRLGDAASAPLKIADRTWLLVVSDPHKPSLGLPILMAIMGVSLAALLGALILVWSRNERMQELRRLAHQDSLTGLKNRRRFDEDFATEMARCRREKHRSALLLLDLDNFKEINDSLGHAGGDRTIEEVAGVLRARMRETDLLARLGGDEFAIVLPRCNVSEASVVAETICAAVRNHVPQEGLPPITVSIGIAIFGDTGTSLDAVRTEADSALYAAKDAGRDAVRIFNTTADVGQAPSGS